MTDPNTSPDDDQLTMAKLAYGAYAQTVGFKAVNGDKLPDFDAMTDLIQAAWVSAVNAIVGYLQGGPPAVDELGALSD